MDRYLPIPDAPLVALTLVGNLNIGIVGSNPVLCMNACPRFYVLSREIRLPCEHVIVYIRNLNVCLNWS